MSLWFLNRWGVVPEPPAGGFISFPFRWLSGSSTGKTLAADSGSFVFSGQAAGFRTTRRLTAAAASFSFTGSAAALTHAAVNRLNANFGSFTFSGQPVGLRLTHKLGAGAGAFAFSGQAAALRKGITLAAGLGTYTFAGQSATLRLSRRLSPRPSPGAGGYFFTGTAAGLTWSGIPVPPVFKAGRISLALRDAENRPADPVQRRPSNLQTTKRRN